MSTKNCQGYEFLFIVMLHFNSEIGLPVRSDNSMSEWHDLATSIEFMGSYSEYPSGISGLHRKIECQNGMDVKASGTLSCAQTPYFPAFAIWYGVCYIESLHCGSLCLDNSDTEFTMG